MSAAERIVAADEQTPDSATAMKSATGSGSVGLTVSWASVAPPSPSSTTRRKS